MKVKRFEIEKSNWFIVEKHKPIIPTIMFWSEKSGNHMLVTFKFVFWKWWIKFGFCIVL